MLFVHYTTTREMNEIEIRRRQTFNLNFIAFFAWLLHAQRAIQWFSFVQNTQQTLTVYCSAKRMQHNSRRQVQKKKHTYRKTKPLKDDGSSRHTTKICDSITYYASLFPLLTCGPFFLWMEVNQTRLGLCQPQRPNENHLFLRIFSQVLFLLMLKF